jgi:fatty acid desaturase
LLTAVSSKPTSASALISLIKILPTRKVDFMTDTSSLPTARSFSEIVRAERLTEPSATYSTLRLVGFLGGWPALYFLASWARTPVVWVLAWLLQALLFEGCNIGTHESAHNNLYRRRGLNYLAGLAWAVPILYDYAAYRASHLEHHKNTHDLEKDSEPVYERMRLHDYLIYMALSGIAYTFILLFEGTVASLGKGKTWMRSGHRRRLAVLSTVIVVAQFGLVAFGLVADWRLTLELWLVPFGIYATVLAPMVSHPEHSECEFGPASPFATTRTTFSNRFISFFIWNINLHTAHHLLPSIPGQKLPKFQSRIEEHCRYTSRSYTAWHLGYLRSMLRGAGAAPIGASERAVGEHERS